MPTIACMGLADEWMLAAGVIKRNHSLSDTNYGEEYLTMAAGMIHIGTSEWHYRHWQGVFYPENLPAGDFLDHYCRKFNTVEINNSFYRLPEEDTLRTWRRQTPDHFLFTVKASRYITHMKKLKDARQPAHELLRRAELLGNKLGPILFQLPPRWHSNVPRLREFLGLLPGGFRYAFEFRDESWFNRKVYDTLSRAGAAFCIYHLAGLQSPKEITADFVYLRLHGPGGSYQGRYDTKTLTDWGGAFSTWKNQGKEIYCYFDNDQNGFAAINALELIAMLNIPEATEGGTQ